MVKYKSFTRSIIGDQVYRFTSQAVRFFRYVISPRYEDVSGFLEYYIKPGMTCFDVGACYGHYCRLLSGRVGRTGAIYAFEPSRMTFRFFLLARKIFGWKNVHVRNCALADRTGETILTTPEKAHGGFGIAISHINAGEDTSGLKETVTLNTLDNFVSEHAIDACDFIKCDIEGAEMLFLQGARNTIQKFLPAIIMEINGEYLQRNNHGWSGIQETLGGMGYKFYLFKNRKLAPVPDLRVPETYICLPPARVPEAILDIMA